MSQHLLNRDAYDSPPPPVGSIHDHQLSHSDHYEKLEPQLPLRKHHSINQIDNLDQYLHPEVSKFIFQKCSESPFPKGKTSRGRALARRLSSTISKISETLVHPKRSSISTPGSNLLSPRASECTSEVVFREQTQSESAFASNFFRTEPLFEADPPASASMAAAPERVYTRSSLGSINPQTEAKTVNRVYPIKKGYVDTPEGQIHYRKCGDRVPNVLLLHHSPASSAMFSSALPRLAAKGFTAVALDLPCSGESFVLRKEPMLEDLTDAVMTAVHKLGFVLPFSIVGHQSGASLSIHLASEYPNVISKLALWGIPVVGIMSRGDILREESPDYANELHSIVNSYVQETYPPDGYPWQLKVRGLIDMLRMYDKRNWGNRPMALVNSEGLLKQIKQPVLCMAGDREPYQKATMKAALLLQQGKYHNLGTAGTDVVDEFPDDYVQSIFDFFTTTGLPLERSSCTIPAASLSPPESAWFKKMGNISMLQIPGTTGEPNQGLELHRDDINKAASAEKGRRKSDSRLSNEDKTGSGEFSQSTSRISDSEPRNSGDKRKITFKSLVKGKFLG